jgi:succinoglycan biosynthesis protein ExoA
VGSVALTAVLGLVSPWFAVLLAVIVGCYLLASLVVSIRTAAKEAWRYLPLLPLAFACLHLSYGAGFLAGVLRFLVQRATGKRPEKAPHG